MFCYITHPGVSSFLEFLCNGLVGGHDNKHLNAHVEDAHWDQVGHIVPIKRLINRGIDDTKQSIYTSTA